MAFSPTNDEHTSTIEIFGIKVGALALIVGIANNNGSSRFD
jgi:hypothetical protein